VYSSQRILMLIVILKLDASWEEVVNNSDDQIVKYWRKVCFNIIAKMVLISYILYKENV
jgi:hypothetical protein